jgi:hypothetical protein
MAFSKEPEGIMAMGLSYERGIAICNRMPSILHAAFNHERHEPNERKGRDKEE